MWPALATTSAILIVGSLPMGPAGAAALSDKVLHFVGFGIVAWLWCRAFRFVYREASRGRVLLYGFSASVLLGGGLEGWQGLLPHRSCELLDWAADALGAALGALLTAVCWALTRARAAAP